MKLAPPAQCAGASGAAQPPWRGNSRGQAKRKTAIHGLRSCTVWRSSAREMALLPAGAGHKGRPGQLGEGPFAIYFAMTVKRAHMP